ncbi:hypothetical protein B0T19DRAFT_469447 [Cercophora scortea]|uniref:MYND-type domain-containing protein n=1 Tax=Cercophora scortea TaxID=314031 RepID=A0AAE0I3D7_9PEZI|nr:hypothetical protein B0T19DRAFT_469447 [Cercophora scortea]
MFINLSHVANVDNKNHFPSKWNELPVVGERSPNHFRADGYAKRHWCFLGEIVSATKNLLGHQVVIKDFDSREGLISVLFPLDRGAGNCFNLKNFQVGHTLAIMNAQRELLDDETWCIRVDRHQYPGVHIFPYTHDNAVAVAQALYRLGPHGGVAECFNCPAELQRSPPTRCCQGCRLAQYCSSECQDDAWAHVHDKECVAYQDVALQSLFSLDFTRFMGAFSFPQQ